MTVTIYFCLMFGLNYLPKTPLHKNVFEITTNKSFFIVAFLTLTICILPKILRVHYLKVISPKLIDILQNEQGKMRENKRKEELLLLTKEKLQEQRKQGLNVESEGIELEVKKKERNVGEQNIESENREEKYREESGNNLLQALGEVERPEEDSQRKEEPKVFLEISESNIPTSRIKRDDGESDSKSSEFSIPPRKLPSQRSEPFFNNNHRNQNYKFFKKKAEPK
jgi:hypothetical protein